MPDYSLDIINARLVGYQELYRICIRQSKISTAAPMATGVKQFPPSDLRVLDVKGDWISQGGIDLQINGALGLAFPDLNLNHLDQLAEICRFLWTQGVDGFLPTLVTTSIENIGRSLHTIATFLEQSQPDPQSARILGVHLEGPFLNLEKRGAHPKEYLLPLQLDQVKRVLGDYASLVKVITLAPELDPTETVIPFLKSLGMTVSLGHSQATAAQAQAAFEQGASMVTHAFNAMPGLHHREPGLLGAALLHPTVYCGLIADSQHVSPLMVDLLLRVGRGTRSPIPHDLGIFLVSDALAPLGLPDGTYPWDNRQIEVQDGTARLKNGTLAGTTLPLLVGVQNLVKWGVCEVGEAIALATTAPRRAIGLPTLPPLIAGQSADLLRWHLKQPEELVWERMSF
ncbi:N-acetylglucosamine-6-phosphate deacetylase [Leptolyngbya sp. FACHB-541]|uniref:N-acetylglucosamine-6-phosphate deacetylase n=1 Tax=Leptolyngbya sp. FACHB-541 TaxID=2692810 RepID=UPI00168933EF|nr:N-acetylglucosamine-6-phosphate deacetylase [Leptolyngbya sp. FACHB-541]MBD1999971.1 N-acetylglucosamine-6-phosphate deacetylase [Leptolyngbya sp. FACHB-541]